MEKEAARKQFEEMTEKLGIEHTFTFDEAWDFAMFKRQQTELSKSVPAIPAGYTKDQFFDFVKEVQSKFEESPRALKGEELRKANPLKHSFADGCYIREIFNPKGMLLITKVHKVNHPFFLLKGDMSILTEEGEIRLKAPYYGITKAGTQRIIYAHEDCIFVTVQATTETDVEKIEEQLTASSYEEYKKFIEDKKGELICHTS